MRHVRARGLAMLPLLLVLGLAGCGNDQSDQQSADEETTSRTTTASPTGNEETFAVLSTGDGPIGLSASEPAEGQAQEVSGRLIVGPGGCLALTAEAQPRLLVFGGEPEFVLRGDRPSVTTAALGTVRVGERLSLEASMVPRADTTGVPERCTHGAADTLLVTVE